MIEFSSGSLHAHLYDARQQAEASGRWRTLTTSHVDSVYVEQNGTRYLSFCSNDYLGTAASNTHRRTIKGASASQLITGHHPAYARLASLLSAMKQSEAALIFGSGYLAAIGTIPALVGKGDLVLMDRLSHACLIDGVRLSGARFQRFQHNDMAHLETLLARHRAAYRHCLIVTETVFGMDGDRAPLPELGTLALAHDAWLMTDDAHGLGLPAPHTNPADIQMGTLSKAAGAYGGYVCGSRLLIDHLASHARSAIFSTALPEAIIQAAMDGLTCMQNEPERAEQVMCHARYVCDALVLQEPQSPIIPVVLGDNDRVMEVHTALKVQGILVAAIRPPTVPEGTARLRISLSAAHCEEDVERLVQTVKNAMGNK